MDPESSPFRPGQTVPAEYFVGRNDEIGRLRQLVSASGTGRLTVGFVSGERGIGKTSLAAFMRRLVEREDRVIGSHVLLGGAGDVREMLRRTLVRMVNDGVDRPWYGKLADFHRDKKGLDPFLRRMKALGALEEDPEIRGGYRFPNRLHALYFFMESRRHRGDRRDG